MEWQYIATLPHSIFEISPSDGLWLLAQCEEVISQWVLDVFLIEHETHQADADPPSTATFQERLMQDLSSVREAGIELLTWCRTQLDDTWVDLLRAHDVDLSWSHSTFQHQRE